MAVETVVTSQPRVEERGSSVSWGAIFCGALITLSVQLLFTLLGGAVGLSAFDPERGESLGTGASVGAGIYLFITMLISFFIGGYVASRMAGYKLKIAAILHSLTSWAVVTGFFTFIVGSGIGSLLGGVLNVARMGAATVVQQGQSPQQGQTQQQAQPQQQDRNAAVETLSRTLNIPQSEARRIINEAEQRAQQLQARSGQIAGTVTDVTASSSWIAFFTLFFGALAAIAGGLIGSPYGRHTPEAGRMQERRVA